MKKKPNTIEKEINKIRVELYNQQKSLSTEEWVKQTNERAEMYVKKYGIKKAN